MTASAVDGRHAGHGDCAAAGTVQLDRIPVGQPRGTLPQALSAAGGGEGERDVGEQGTAGVVEIVGVLVMGEQDYVNATEIGGAAGEGGRLGQPPAVRLG